MPRFSSFKNAAERRFCVRTIRLARIVALSIVGACLLSSDALAQQPVAVPAAMVYDSTGNLFIADAGRNEVLEVSVGGVLSVAAGTGEQGFGGDGGKATEALLNEPSGLAIGADGTLFVADTGNRRVRSISSGIIRTIAGTGMQGDAGDGGAALSALFGRPTALAVTSSGALLVCDTKNHRVRAIANGTIQAFAGNGVQGFAGDGAAATAAEFDSPNGIAVMSDGRVVVADSHNQRLRIVEVNGVVSTFAGNGSRGYAGDGGPATAATLSLPQGVSVSADGSVLFADSNNQRIRRINTAGSIFTIAGSGVQGVSNDGAQANSSALDVPRSVATSPYGSAGFGDAAGDALRAVAANGNVYLVPAPAERTSTVTLTLPVSTVYGQTSAAINVSAAAQPQGVIQLQEGGNVLGSGMLTAGGLTLALASLPASTHTLTASYSGDGVNPSALSTPANIEVKPASAIATANPQTVVYGEVIPTLSGSVTGILPQDVANVSVVYSSSTATLPDVGTYPIFASLSGSGSSNYVLSSSPSSGALKVKQAQSTTQMQSVLDASYAGLPVTLNASVSPQFAGTPDGGVDFLESGTVVAHGNIVNGVVTASYLTPAAGTHSISASYLGSKNFLASTSQPAVLTVSPLPDFNVVSSVASQSVQGGLTASFLLTLAPQGGPFTGSVSFSVRGQPAGAVVSFSPTTVVPGATGASTTLSIQVPAQHAAALSSQRFGAHWTLVALACSLPFLMRRRRTMMGVACAFLLLGTVGCGARVAPTTVASSQDYSLVVTATSTNLIGAVVTHNVPLTLTVQ